MSAVTRLLSDHLAAERHLGGRAAWLRAAVLGANDGLISTASLVVGVAAADNARSAVLVAGIAGLTAGALSMAAGEYVSVSSQLDTERADLAREKAELAADPSAEADELAAIYERRGLSPGLARAVAAELSAQERLPIHARDELGIDINALAKPKQASTVSALSFVSGAIVPVLVVALAPATARIAVTIVATLIGLVILGVVGARLGGAPEGRAAGRVFVGGVLALAIALGIGRLTGAAV
jgi:VIT1/CCC1 family predicted Fe2+/Mn2+ transporter